MDFAFRYFNQKKKKQRDRWNKIGKMLNLENKCMEISYTILSTFECVWNLQVEIKNKVCSSSL